MPAVLKVVIVLSARDKPSSFKAGLGMPLRIFSRREPEPAARMTAIGSVLACVSSVDGIECFNDLSC